MAQTYIGTVKSTSGLMIRNGPGTEYSIASEEVLNEGDRLYIYDTQTNGAAIWGNIGTGWVCVSYKGQRYIDLQIPPKKSSRSVSPIGPTQENRWDDKERLYFSDEEWPLSTNIGYNVLSYTSRQYVIDSSMRLFGLPYQFNAAADPRYAACNSQVGREFAQKFFSDGTIAYIIPGKASFLPGMSGKQRSTGLAMVNAASVDFKLLQDKIKEAKFNKELRFYDFQEDYTSYMHYVNVMCRAVATFLELDSKINDENGNTITFQKYDWRNYRWTSKEYNSSASNALSGLYKNVAERVNTFMQNIFLGAEDNTASGKEKQMSLSAERGNDLNLSELGASQNYVMFYVDPSIDGNESASNNLTNSKIQDTLDAIHDKTNEIGFILNSSAAGSIMENIGESTVGDMVSGALDGISSSSPLGNVFTKILDAGASVVSGDNVIVPKVYQNSDYSRSYSITCHLRAPYGDKLCVYTDVLVPMLHLLALALPKQSTANTYGSPFLIKMYIPGIINCGLGIVSSIQITKSQNEDSRSIDGLPMEVDVTLQIEDLYSRLTMSPSTEPLLFANNSSLIEYLATISGLNLITPQLSTKLRLLSNTIANAVTDMPANVAAIGSDFIDRTFASFLSL